MSFGQDVEIGVECQIFVIVIFFNCGQGTFKVLYGCINSKNIIFSDLYYVLSDLILMSAEKSKQTFNIKFVIRRPVEMTWTRH